MEGRWKEILMIVIDGMLGVYLILAITAWNKPEDDSQVCNEVNIQVEEGSVKGFLTANDIKLQLQRAKLYPLGDNMDRVKSRQIEEALTQNPFVKSAQCYKTQTGHINISVVQRLPVMRIKANNGDDYYIDEFGNIMPNSHFVSNLVVATGNIQKKYAQKVLTKIGQKLLTHDLWNYQVEQLNILDDGTVELVPRVGDHIVYLGNPTHIDQKLNRLEKFYRYGLSKAGWNKYSYISLEFDNQIICTKRKIVHS